MQIASFGSDARYAYVHHRALNDFVNLEHALHLVDQYPELNHVFEGDVCWYFGDGRQEVYFRHPSYVLDSLSLKEIDDGLNGRRLVTIADVLRLGRERKMSFIIELKVGRGDWRKAINFIVSSLDLELPGRYWLDGFSLSMLSYSKDRYPHVPVTLHTECVLNSTVFVGAPEWPPFRIRKLNSLKKIDGISIRWRGSDAHMQKSAESVRSNGKVLMISRIHSVHQYLLSKKWGAYGGYIHGSFEQYIRS